MIVYEVNVHVDADAFADYRAWLDEHVRHMLACPGFESAQIFECRDPQPASGQRDLCVHYRLTDLAALQRYLRDDAPRMRADGMTRFGGRFSATRRVLAPG
jgi:hypothetical protein